MSEKLQKVLARLGYGSRREIEALIAQGRIEVNGVVAKIGDRVEGPINVKIDGRAIDTKVSTTPKVRVLMYHKPVGQVTTYSDPQDRPTVFQKLPRVDHGKWLYVGRLDINTSGLLLFTNDGEMANKLMHPSSNIERVYACRVFGNVSESQIETLTHGVRLDDGPAKFERVVFVGGEGRNQWFNVTLKEGRNREVRRLWDSIGLLVSRLMRISYAGIDLDPKLKEGQYRELSVDEINNLRAKCNLPPLSESQIPNIPLSEINKNKRGRPLGSKNKSSKSMDDNLDFEQFANKKRGRPVGSKKKRPRGRPVGYKVKKPKLGRPPKVYKYGNKIN